MFQKLRRLSIQCRNSIQVELCPPSYYSVYLRSVGTRTSPWITNVYTLNLMCSTHSYPFLTEDSILSENEDIDEIMGFLLELCEGEVLRSIICDAVVQECLDVSQSGQELRRVDSEPSSSSFHFLSTVCSCDGASDCYEHETTSFLDLLLDVVIKLDFPEKMVTFLLQLLPDQEYKV